MIFSVFQKIWFWGILGPPYCGIGATIRIGREMLCLPYAGFLLYTTLLTITELILVPSCSYHQKQGHDLQTGADR